MNILIISSLLPYPLNSGGAQAQYNMIDYLRDKHHITFLFTEDGNNSMEAMKQLQKLWPEVDFRPFRYWRQLCYPPFFRDKATRALKLKFTPSDERFKVERILKPYGVYFSHDFISFVRNTITEAQANIVQVEFYPCMGIVRHLPANIKSVFIQHEIRFVRNERYLENFHLTHKEKELKSKVKADEIECMNLYSQIVTLTDTDKRILQSSGVTTPISVSPAAINSPIEPYEDNSGKIIFIGAYRHIPNQEGLNWFMRKVAPLLAQNGTPPSLSIIGAGWPDEYQESSIPVSRLGFVEKLHDAAKGGIMIVPLLTGSGMRMKILEAAALSLPIVTTTVGVEGLDFQHEVSCLIADTPQEFAAAILQLEQDKHLRQTIAENALEIFKKKYSVQALGELRNSIYTL